jgi:hypothetical protein
MDAWLHYGVPDASTADEIIAWARANSFEVRHTEGSLRVDVGITVRDPDELQLYLAWRGDPISWVASAAHLAAANVSATRSSETSASKVRQ